MYKLSSLKNSNKALIKNITGDQRFILRALAMGFTPETPVIMIQNNGLGPILVFLRDTQVAIGRREAEKISVTGENLQ